MSHTFANACTRHGYYETNQGCPEPDCPGNHGWVYVKHGDWCPESDES